MRADAERAERIKSALAVETTGAVIIGVGVVAAAYGFARSIAVALLATAWLWPLASMPTITSPSTRASEITVASSKPLR